MTIKPAVQNILGQVAWLLEYVSNEEYSQIIKNLNGSSIGQHVRHTLEFFECLFDGLEEGQVNYDDRHRNVFLENNTLEAKAVIEKLQEQLELNSDDTKLILNQCYGDQNFEIPTTLNRELVYNIEHAVHHLALIRVGLKEIKPSLKLDECFGLASSTLKYRRSMKNPAAAS